MRFSLLFLAALVSLAAAQFEDMFADVSDDFYNQDPTV
jgi:hypothetical protein